MKTKYFLFTAFALLLTHKGFSQGTPTKLPCVADKVRNAYQEIHGKPQPRPMARTDEDSSFTYVVPVVFHVFHENGPERNVTLEKALTQIDLMNQAYNRYGRGWNDEPVGARANIKFCLASIDPWGNPTTGLEYKFVQGSRVFEYNAEDDSILKSNSIWDPERYLNIWTVGDIQIDELSASGYCYYPEDVAGSAVDGPVVRFDVVGFDVDNPISGYGITPIHEVGHWLGLYHTWGFDDTCDDDDECEDTPLTDALVTPDCFNPYYSCGGHRRQEANYMDYSYDFCQNLFTKCQVERMRTAMINYRAGIIDQENLRLTGCSQVFDSLPSANRIDIYPNPASDGFVVYFDMASEEVISLKLFNADGRLMVELPEAGKGRGVVGMDIENVCEGLYQLIVETPTLYIRKTLSVIKY